nr:MAG TPA: hypothetical protein [Caudoviricetes sp.]
MKTKNQNLKKENNNTKRDIQTGYPFLITVNPMLQTTKNTCTEIFLS